MNIDEMKRKVASAAALKEHFIARSFVLQILKWPMWTAQNCWP